MDYKAIGAQVKETREKARLPLDQVARELSVHPQDLINFEDNGTPIATPSLAKLYHEVLHCQNHELLHVLYPYQSPIEWIQAYMKGDIDETALAYGLEIDGLEASRRVQEIQSQSS